MVEYLHHHMWGVVATLYIEYVVYMKDKISSLC